MVSNGQGRPNLKEMPLDAAWNRGAKGVCKVNVF